MKDYAELAGSITKEAFNNGTYSSSFEYGDIPLNEVNAWTYWQGLGVRKCKILVIGQDWGSKNKSQKYLEAIDWMQKHGNPTDKVYYFNFTNNHKGFPTDEKLAELFDTFLGYKNIKEKHYNDLFFTNLIPGLRKNSKSSGGFRKGWMTDKVKSDLKDLVDILEPSIIICLGKDVFEQVAKIYGTDDVLDGKTWNEYLDMKNNHLMIPDKNTAVFPVAHTGSFGQFNRNRDDKKNSGINKNKTDKNKKDWEKIARYNNNELDSQFMFSHIDKTNRRIWIDGIFCSS